MAGVLETTVVRSDLSGLLTPQILWLRLWKYFSLPTLVQSVVGWVERAVGNVYLYILKRRKKATIHI